MGGVPVLWVMYLYCRWCTCTVCADGPYSRFVRGGGYQTLLPGRDQVTLHLEAKLFEFLRSDLDPGNKKCRILTPGKKDRISLNITFFSGEGVENSRVFLILGSSSGSLSRFLFTWEQIYIC